MSVTENADPIFTYKASAQSEDEAPLVLRMDDDGLVEARAQARAGGFFSYVCGALLVMMKHVHTHCPNLRLPAVR